MAEMERFAPQWLAGCKLREIAFQPTFHKHAGELCHGVFIHAEGPFYDHRGIQAVAAAGARLQGDPPPLSRLSTLWRDFPYEYVFDKLAIDVINGSPLLREWVDDPASRARRPRCDRRFPTSALGTRSARPHLLY